IPVEVDYADEFRYREPIVDRRTLVVAMSQSGETVDVLVSMAEAKKRGAKVVTIVNVVGAQSTRVAEGQIYMHVGPEVGVAATKTFLGFVVSASLLAIRLAQGRGTMAVEEQARALQALV